MAMTDIHSSLDYEGAKLVKLISGKKEFLKKLNPQTMQYKYLLSEIEFLEQDILPMILSKNMYLNEINRYFDVQMPKVAELSKITNVNGILYYHHFHDKMPYDEKVPAAIAFISNYDYKKMVVQFQYLDIDNLRSRDAVPLEVDPILSHRNN